MVRKQDKAVKDSGETREVQTEKQKTESKSACQKRTSLSTEHRRKAECECEVTWTGGIHHTCVQSRHRAPVLSGPFVFVFIHTGD